jgi:subtilisin family serine protease
MSLRPETNPASHLCGAVVDHDVPRSCHSRAAHRERRRALVSFAAAALLCLGALLGTAGPAAAAPPTDGVHAWNFRQARVSTTVQNAGHGGSGVVIAVVDTWVDASHPELSGRVMTGANCTGGTCLGGGTGKDACGHGTHVAGTAAGAHWGVAPRARILPVRVLSYDKVNGECTGSTTAVAAGIRWATGRADVINLSLAPEDTDAQTSHGEVTAAVQDAVAHGKVVVFAAGNDDKPVQDQYGGGALIVAATAPSGSLAPYSQRDSDVSVAAPGGQPRGHDCASDGSDCVVSAWLGHGYAALAGTSMAAPHVSGLAALLLGQNAGRSGAAVIDRITGTADAVSGGGAGRIDAAAALGVRYSSSATGSPKPHTASPTHRATAASKPPSRTTVRPSRPPARSRTPTPTPTPSVNQAVPSLDPDGDDGLPLAPLAIAFACLGGLAVGFVSVGRARS